MTSFIRIIADFHRALSAGLYIAADLLDGNPINEADWP